MHLILDSIQLSKPNTLYLQTYNQAFQAPLIDRFLYSMHTTGQVFNGFMSPSKSRTFNIGLNYLTDNSKTKVTLYRSNIKDEMFLCKSMQHQIGYMVII